MSTLAEIEKAILGLPPQDKSRLVDWLDEHRDDLSPLSDAQRLELRRRRDEILARPELAQPLDEAFFDRLRRKVADVRALLKHPLVDCDFEEAALAYALRDADVADRFINTAEAALRELARDPLRYRARFEDIRRVNLSGFPYGVFYFVRDEIVYVIALLHAARDHEAALAKRRSMWA